MGAEPRLGPPRRSWPLVLGAVCLGLLITCSSPTTTPSQLPRAAADTSAAPGSLTAPDAQSPALAGGDSASPPLQKVKAAVFSTSIAYGLHQEAQDLGYTREEGLDSEVAILAGAPMVAALATGEIGFADMTGSALRAAAQGVPIKTVECHGVRPHYIIGLAPGLSSAQDLAGKSFVVSAAAADDALVARDVIAQRGGDPETVTFVALGGSHADRYAALVSGHAGGGSMDPANAVRSEQEGHKLVFLNRPGDLAPICATGLAASNRTIQDEGPLVTQYIRALHKTVTRFQNDRAWALSYASRVMQVDHDTATKVLDLMDLPNSYSTSKDVAQQSIVTAIQYSQARGDIPPSVSFHDIADLSERVRQ